MEGEGGSSSFALGIKKDKSAPMAVRHCMQSGVVGTRRRTVDVVRRRSSSSATRSTVATGRRAGGLRRPPAAAGAAAATPRGGTVSSATPCCGLSACMDRRRRPGRCSVGRRSFIPTSIITSSDETCSVSAPARLCIVCLCGCDLHHAFNSINHAFLEWSV